MQLPNITAIAAFCNELRQAREFKRISIEEVAQITRITRDYLDALENGEWERIPRAYLRGYLALYASAVSMNSEKVLKVFDQLVSIEKQTRSAVLDENPPLLSEPQYVEVTRSSIQAAWYAALVRHRTGFLIVTGIFIAVLMGFLYWRAHWGTIPEKLLPFAIAVRENSERIYSPLTILPVKAESLAQHEDSVAVQPHWVRWIGTARGSMTVERDRDSAVSFYFEPYDTIKIQYIKEMTVRVYPPGSARARQDTTRLFPNKALSGDIEVFVISAPLDSASVPDSLPICEEKVVD